MGTISRQPTTVAVLSALLLGTVVLLVREKRRNQDISASRGNRKSTASQEDNVARRMYTSTTSGAARSAKVTPSAPTTEKVFISYNSANHEQAMLIASALAESGVEYFLDRKDIGWGDDIQTEITTGLQQCTALIVILSEESLNSRWVTLEIGHALGLEIKILPFLVDSSLELPSYMRKLKYVKTVEAIASFFDPKYALEEEREEPDDNTVGFFYLGELFSMWVLSDELDHRLMSAFRSILIHRGVSHPNRMIRDWIQKAREKAAQATGMLPSEWSNITQDLSIGTDVVPIDHAFKLLYRESNKRKSASDIANIRLCLIGLYGEGTDVEYLKKWRKESGG